MAENISNQAVRRTETLPWVEKYRPSSIADIASQPEAVAALKDVLADESSVASMPHMMFYGPPGTGKTSAALALCRDLWGGSYRARLLELNASDERGIDVIRTRVRDFAKLAVQKSLSDAAEDSHPAPAFKIVLLDEADMLTAAAQSALRRVMEDFAHTTRFILLCNRASKIMAPVASRCARFHFRALPAAAVEARLTDIIASEGAGERIEPGAIAAVAAVAGGDMRQSVTLLQTVLAARHDRAATAADVREAAGIVDSAVIGELLATAEAASTPADVAAAAEAAVAAGHSAPQILENLSQMALRSGLLEVAIACGRADAALLRGAAPATVLSAAMLALAAARH